MAAATVSEFLPALVNELAAAVGAVAGSPVPVTSGSGVTGPGWTIPITATGSLRGTARLTLAGDGVLALLHVVLGADADTSEAATIDLLAEMASQAASALCLKEGFSGLTLAVGSIAAGEPDAEQTSLFALPLGELPLQIAAAATLEVMAAAPAPTATAPASTGAPAPAAVAATKPGTRVAAPTTAVPTNNLEVVLDIELPLAVRFGSTVMSIRALSSLGPGSIVDMGRSPDDPVEILVCGKPIARAEVVIVGGNYGVRITDLTSAAERIRAMEGQL